MAIAGVGNCASSLVQGVEYYKGAKEDQFVPGLMHVNFGGYHIRDVKFVAAFDVDANKVGRDLAEAVFTPPNCTIKFSDVPKTGVEVMKGPVLDGLGKYLKGVIPVDATQKPADVAKVLRDTGAQILINYLPVGSYDGSRFYAQSAIDAGCGFINCLPYHELVPVKENGRLHIVPIGKLVEDLVDESYVIANRQDAVWYEPQKSISVISFDPHTFQVKFSKIKRMLKRKGTGSMIEVTVQGGLRIAVSPDHPMLVLTRTGITSKTARQMVPGDLLPLAKRLPLQTEAIPSEIDLIQELAAQPYAGDILVTGELNGLLRKPGLTVRQQADRLGITYSQMKTFRSKNYLPLPLYIKLETNRGRRRKVLLRFKKSKKCMPPFLPINKTLACWLGFFLAEGWYHQTQICFSINKREADLINEIRGEAERLFHDKLHVYHDRENALELSLQNKLAVCILRDIFGMKQGARNKEVPTQIFSWSPELIHAVLDAYFLGNGSRFYVSSKIPSVVLSTSTASEALAAGIRYLLLKCGSRATLTEVKRSATGLPAYVHPKSTHYRQFIIRVEGEEVSALNLDLMEARYSLYHKTGRGRGHGIPIHERVPSLIVQQEDVIWDPRDRHTPTCQLNTKSYFHEDSLKPTSELLRHFCEGDIYFAEVLRVQERTYDGDFYDFEVEETHNFMHGFGVFSHNCIPEFITSSKEWARKFEAAGLPCAGDDIKSQLGATILHRTLARLCIDRGIKLEKSYQLNIGGNTDFLNMLEEERLSSKRISKTEAVSSQVPYEVPLRIGPSDYVPFLKDNKVCYIHMVGKKFGDIPLTIDVKLSVEDSPNSAGVVIDAIRGVKLALDRGSSGALLSISSYFFKHPPVQYTDDEARQAVEDFITGRKKR